MRKIQEELERLGIQVAKATGHLTKKNYTWYTKETRATVAKLRNSIDKVRGLLEKEHRSDAAWMEIENEFQTMQIAFREWEGLTRNQPGTKLVMQMIDKRLHPQQLLARLRQDTSRAAVLEKKTVKGPRAGERQLSRRRFLGWLGGLTAAGATAAMTPKIIEQLFSEEPPKQEVVTRTAATWARPGLYVQIGAMPTLEKAREFALSVGPGFKVHEAPGESYQFKTLWAEPFPDIESAEAWIVAQEEKNDRFPLEIGIVMMNGDGFITWMKTTFSERVLETRQGMVIGATRIFDSFIKDAVALYPLFGIPEKDALLVHAVIHVESGGRPEAVSPKGAKGLMQLMPATWEDIHHGKKGWLGQRYDGSEQFLHKNEKPINHTCDPFDPKQNIDAGVHYLSELFTRFPVKDQEDNNGLRRILRMYNAGVKSVLTGRADKSKESQEYAEKVKEARRTIRQ